MEPLKTLDTAEQALLCYLCGGEILVNQDSTIVGTGLSFWPAHRECYRQNQLPLWYQ